jgi:hypothetical protein
MNSIYKTFYGETIDLSKIAVISEPYITGEYYCQYSVGFHLYFIPSEEEHFAEFLQKTFFVLSGKGIPDFPNLIKESYERSVDRNTEMYTGDTLDASGNLNNGKLLTTDGWCDYLGCPSPRQKEEYICYQNLKKQVDEIIQAWKEYKREYSGK